MTRPVQVPLSERPGGQCHRQRPGLPVLVKHRAVLALGLDRAVAESPAHIVDPGHAGACGRPVPIMLSRVTSAASAARSSPSVPAGRIGSTR